MARTKNTKAKPGRKVALRQNSYTLELKPKQKPGNRLIK